MVLMRLLQIGAKDLTVCSAVPPDSQCPRLGDVTADSWLLALTDIMNCLEM